MEAGEEITITVAGRPSARLVGASARRWRSFDHIADLFDGPEDSAWEEDRQGIDQSLRDPWTAV